MKSAEDSRNVMFEDGNEICPEVDGAIDRSGVYKLSMVRMFEEN